MYKHTAADHLRKVDGLAGSLYLQNASLKRHRASPLVTEREQFLQYLLQRGISVGFVQRVALYLRTFTKLLNMTRLRMVHPLEIGLLRNTGDSVTGKTTDSPGLAPQSSPNAWQCNFSGFTTDLSVLAQLSRLENSCEPLRSFWRKNHWVRRQYRHIAERLQSFYLAMQLRRGLFGY